MSLINGISGLGGGISNFSGAALTDEAFRKPLLNGAPSNTEAAPPPAAAAGTVADAPAATPAPADAPSTSVVGVPAAYLPIYQAASKRTGIPLDVLVAQGKQESGFDPSAVSKTGAVGLHQILPSTAANPGYGLKGIDPATLKDPSVNINFAADYLKAKAGNPNFNDPASVDAALQAYNGGDDPNYVANVRSHIGAS